MSPSAWITPSVSTSEKKSANLARRKIQHGDDQPLLPLLLPLVRGDLRARCLHTQVAEIDAQVDRRLPRLGEVVRLNDSPHPHVHLREVVVADLWHCVSPVVRG